MLKSCPGYGVILIGLVLCMRMNGVGEEVLVKDGSNLEDPCHECLMKLQKSDTYIFVNLNEKANHLIY
jgi:hypothetical protein